MRNTFIIRLTLFFLLCIPLWGWAQNPVRYNYVVELDTAKHYLNVELTYKPKDTKELIELNMPMPALVTPALTRNMII